MKLRRNKNKNMEPQLVNDLNPTSNRTDFENKSLWGRLGFPKNNNTGKDQKLFSSRTIHQQVKHLKNSARQTAGNWRERFGMATRENGLQEAGWRKAAHVNNQKRKRSFWERKIERRQEMSASILRCYLEFRARTLSRIFYGIICLLVGHRGNILGLWIFNVKFYEGTFWKNEKRKKI